MGKLFLIILFLLVTNISRGQDNIFNFGTTKVDKYIEQENTIGSTLISNSVQYDFIGYSYELAQPFRYQRNLGKFVPRAIVSYNFSLPDSIVRIINVEIDSSNNLMNNENYFEPASRLPEFNAEYDKLQKELILHFGNPIQTEALTKKPGFENDFYWSRRDAWDSDKAKADLELVFSDQRKQNGTYRIRVNINLK